MTLNDREFLNQQLDLMLEIVEDIIEFGEDGSVQRTTREI